MHRPNTIPEKYAAQIADILTTHAGARLSSTGTLYQQLDRESFIRYLSTSQHPEWRFGGLLGSGGKFYGGSRWRVDCYSEDYNKARKATIEATNAALADLYQQFISELEAETAEPEKNS